MASLRDAATASDASLDWALLRVGILAPVELADIRALLTRPGTVIRAAVNVDGHRIVEIVDGDLVVQVHHDGQIRACAATA